MINHDLRCSGGSVSRRQFPLQDTTTGASQKRRYTCRLGWLLLLFLALPAAFAGDARFTFDPDHWQLSPAGHLQPRTAGGGVTARRQYGDFVLDLEFKVEPKANSGVLIRVGAGSYVENGLEIQVLDSYGEAHPTKGSCGALYDMLEPSQTAVKPAGEWNRYLITCRGSKIQVELNGVAIIDADLDRWTEPGKNPDGTKMKFVKMAGKDKPRAGWIGLQDHGDKVSYRKLRVKPLTPPTFPDGAPAPKVVDGWEILFDGTDTAQLRLDPNAWVIRDGALCFLGRPEPTATTAQYGDCSIEFEFKPPKNGIGGVELRRDKPGRGGTGLVVALGDTPACGALLDCAKPSAPASVKVNDWNRCKIVCRGQQITAEINGQPVLQADLDQWITKGQNPDGTNNWYRIPLRDWPRTGHVAFRPPLEYRNIRIENIQ